MRNLTEDNVTEAVIRSFADTADPRLKEILTSLVRHLHAFAREVQLTEKEWLYGVQFLTRTGQISDDERQEFILLSDTLGLSILVDAMNHRVPEGMTESSVLGPFYREGTPEASLGTRIDADTEGEPVVVQGRVTDAQGRPLPGALLDVWQTAPNGFYESQDEDQPDFNLRAKFRTDEQGRYRFRTLKPVSYPIPDDGPVGDMLKAGGRHPYRPAHIHFIVSAEGYRPVVTQLFTEGDPYLDSDAVFGVKNSLVVNYAREDSPERAAEYGVTAPFYHVEYDFGLVPQTRG